MKDKYFRRSIVCIIILMFIGAGIVPSINGDTGIVSKQQIEEVCNDFLFFKSGLLAYWSFDEGTGDTAHDYSGHNYDGTIYGAIWTSGHESFALDFNGIDNYVDLDIHSENLGFNKTDDYTISAWINSSLENTGIIYAMSYFDGVTVYATLELNANGSIIFRTGTAGGCKLYVFSKEGYNNKRWHHVEVKFYGNDVNPTVELYVDDQLEDSITDWLCPISSADFKTAKIGRRSNSETDYFDGKIDEVIIYKYPEDVNRPPDPPTINGTTSVKVNKPTDYILSTTDPESDNVSYWIEWSEDSVTEWDGPYKSGEDVTFTHTWSKKGTYTIKAKAKDTYGDESEVTELQVTVPRNKVLDFNFLERLFERFPYVFPIIRNLLRL